MGLPLAKMVLKIGQSKGCRLPSDRVVDLDGPIQRHCEHIQPRDRRIDQDL